MIAYRAAGGNSRNPGNCEQIAVWLLCTASDFCALLPSCFAAMRRKLREAGFVIGLGGRTSFFRHSIALTIGMGMDNFLYSLTNKMKVLGGNMAVHVVDHPLVRHKLGILRMASTSTSEFRSISNEIAMLLIYEATKNIRTEKQRVQGWAGWVDTEAISGKKVTVVPILRAGLGLMDGVLGMIPGAKISVVGLYRNEKTLEPVEYYVKLASDMEQRLAIILDPMLATGGSLVATIDLLKRHGCRQICSLTLVCAPEGIARVEKAHPDVDIYTAAVDDCLNEQGYIIPGLGDAGDRIFGTR